MANARELLKHGELAAAIDEQTQVVKKRPAEGRERTFLFELLCFAGEWGRAEKQLDALADQSIQREFGVQIYRNNIRAEKSRKELFSLGVAPHFLREPPAYIDLHFDAINRLREGNYTEARKVLDTAEEERPVCPGSLNGRPFEDFRDSNDLIGPILEIFVQEKYSWLPFQHIQRIEIPQPKLLRDLLWTPAQIETRDGIIGEVHLPTLYAGSNEFDSDLVKLGRMTDWRKLSDDLYLPVGLRLFQIDNEEKAMLEMRTIEFTLPDLESPQST